MTITLDYRYPLQNQACGHGVLTWREAGHGPALVLLHGIGSGALSWVGQLEAFAHDYRVLAWDAPGYGASAPLSLPQPLAIDYVHVLQAWLGRLGVDEVILVGHSLGAMVAAACAARAGALHVRGLILANPARGYGRCDAMTRAAKWRERVDAIADGAERMASRRAVRLVAPQTSAEVREAVRLHMAHVTPVGYAQAAHMLAYDDLLAHLDGVHAPVTVFGGELDQVTPAAACAELAHDIGAPYVQFAGVAHASYLENTAAFNIALREACSRATETHHV